VNKNHGFDQRKAPNSSRCFHLESRLNSIFDFKFEYRKQRNIKGMRIKSALGDDPSE
jgi:hypothetical protein